MSLASFASGSNDVVETSIACSIAELSISATSTKAIASSSAISSSRVDADRERRRRARSTAARVDPHVPLRAEDVDDPLDGVVEAVEEASGRGGGSVAPSRLALVHLRAVVVADEMQHPVHERRAPVLADDLRAEDDVAELPRQSRPAGRRARRSGTRARRSPRRCPDAPASARGSRPARRRRGRARRRRFPPRRARVRASSRRASSSSILDAASVVDLDRQHHCSLAVPLRPGLLRVQLVRLDDALDEPVPDDVLVAEAATNAIPSIEPRMSCTWIRPDACSRGRSICVTSPVTTTFEPKPEPRQEHLHLLGARCSAPRRG